MKYSRTFVASSILCRDIGMTKMKSGIMPTPPKTSGRVNYFCSQLGSVSRGGLLIYFIAKFKLDIIANALESLNAKIIIICIVFWCDDAIF